MTKREPSSELALSVAREAVLSHAREVNPTDEFSRTSLELMYAQRGGDPADLPWNNR